MGRLLVRMGKLPEALVACQAGLAIRRKLAREQPEFPDLAKVLADSHDTVGIALRALGKPADAHQAHEAAMAIRRKLLRDYPDVPDVKSGLGRTLHHEAMLDLDAKRFREARDRLREAMTTPESKALVARTLAHWKRDTDLAGIRDARGLAKLPEAEQAALKQFWNDVDGLLATVEGSK